MFRNKKKIYLIVTQTSCLKLSIKSEASVFAFNSLQSVILSQIKRVSNHIFASNYPRQFLVETIF